MGLRVEKEVDVHQRKEKKKKKKNNDAYTACEDAMTEIMVEENFGDRSRKKKHDKKKRKRKERERDEDVSVGCEEVDNDFGVAFTEENKNRTKVKKNKSEDHDNKFDNGCKINNYENDANVKSHLKKEKVGRNQMEFGDSVLLDTLTDEKKKKKKKNKRKEEEEEEDRKNKNKEAAYSYLTENVNNRNLVTEGMKYYQGAEISDTKKGDDRDIVKKNVKKRNKDIKVSNVKKDHASVIETEPVKKKTRNRYKDDTKHCSREMFEKPIEGECVALDDIVEMENSDHIKKKKFRSIQDVGENINDKVEQGMGIGKGDAENFKDSSKKSGKRVKFATNVEVLSSSDGINATKENDEMKSNFGKRYSQEEDKMIKDAVFNYIEKHGLGEEGLQMVLNVKSYPQIKGCWKEICATLPWRSYVSVIHRAHILFERDERRKWTAEEKEFVRKFYEKHGPQWKILAEELGKCRIHVKDTWRRIRLPNQRKGRWTQEEYQTLFDLVNLDLRMKVAEGRKSNKMFRDNISWEAISTKMGTRTNVDCCHKWYDRLASPMVKDGKWAPIDDYYLVNALLTLDACCVEDVNWDDLIVDRSGDVCRRRFKQMVNHLGEHGIKSFSEQVEVLAKRYCYDMLEIQENAVSNSIVE